MRRSIVLVVIASAIVISACGLAYKVPTDAMKPNITREDMCVVNPFAYSSDEIARFDIVIFEMPESEKKRVNAPNSVRQIKRIVGLPGEKLEIRNDKVLINDQLIDEPFEKITGDSDRKRNYGPIVIPDNEYFLLGDNRPESLDSRYFDHPTIKRTDIYSKVVDIKKGYYAKK